MRCSCAEKTRRPVACIDVSSQRSSFLLHAVRRRSPARPVAAPDQSEVVTRRAAVEMRHRVEEVRHQVAVTDQSVVALRHWAAVPRRAVAATDQPVAVLRHRAAAPRRLAEEARQAAVASDQLAAVARHQAVELRRVVAASDQPAAVARHLAAELRHPAVDPQRAVAERAEALQLRARRASPTARTGCTAAITPTTTTTRREQ
jgi:hypothetical protein